MSCRQCGGRGEWRILGRPWQYCDCASGLALRDKAERHQYVRIEGPNGTIRAGDVSGPPLGPPALPKRRRGS